MAILNGQPIESERLHQHIFLSILRGNAYSIVSSGIKGQIDKPS